MNILFVGDVVGHNGRRAFRTYTPELRVKEHIDVVIVNGENCAAGKGFTRKALDELYQGGADIVTSGNHVYDKKDVLEFIDDEPFLIRPANYPGAAPGKGFCIYPFKAKNIGVMTLSGRAFMPPLDDPFQKVEDLLREMQDECDIVLLDFHAETTSEKIAMGWYLDGRVNAVVGTHTHVQTSDAVVLPGGTAFQTDLGMTGPWYSSVGRDFRPVLQKFLSGIPARFDVAEGPATLEGAVITFDPATKRASAIAPFRYREPLA